MKNKTIEGFLVLIIGPLLLYKILPPQQFNTIMMWFGVIAVCYVAVILIPFIFLLLLKILE